MTDIKTEAIDQFTENFGDILATARAAKGPRFAEAAINTFMCLQVSQAFALLASTSTMDSDQLNTFMDGALSLVAALNDVLTKGMNEEQILELQKLAEQLADRKQMLEAKMLAALMQGGGSAT